MISLQNNTFQSLYHVQLYTNSFLLRMLQERFRTAIKHSCAHIYRSAKRFDLKEGLWCGNRLALLRMCALMF